MTFPYYSRLGYRLPRFELSTGASPASEQDVAYSESTFKSFLDLEHSRLLTPPLCIINVFSGFTTAQAPAGPVVQIVPIDDTTVTLIGKPMDLLTVYSCSVHETTHMYQISHLEVMNKYASAEVLLHTLHSLIKTASERSGSTGMGEGGIKGLTFGSMEFRRLIIDIRDAFPYLPFKVDRDILVLLESFPILVQMRTIEFPEVDMLVTHVEDSLRSAINTGLMKMLREDPAKSIYLEALELVYNLHGILPKSYATLIIYSNYLTGLGAQGIVQMAYRLAHDESKIKVLAGVEREVESGGDPLVLAFEHNVFNYEDFIEHKGNLLKIIDDALKICNSGRSFDRLNYIRRKIDSIKMPTELRYLASGFSQNVFSQHLAPNQPSTYYFHANGTLYDKNEVMLFASFFADMVIAINIVKAVVDALEKGKDVRNAIKSVIRCPLKRAPQMRCASSTECEHEKTWLEII
jgi:hypothetical protein